jgi:hypothetical protein
MKSLLLAWRDAAAAWRLARWHQAVQKMHVYCRTRRRAFQDREGRVMADRIKRRDDVSPKRGEREYGDVEFADPTNKKYPIDSLEHVRAAWSYINHEDNAAKYTSDEVKLIKRRIKRAAKSHGVEISED